MKALGILVRGDTGYASRHRWMAVRPGYPVFACQKHLTRLEAQKDGHYLEKYQVPLKMDPSDSMCVRISGKALGTRRVWSLMRTEGFMHSGLTTAPASSRCGPPRSP